MTCTLKPLVNGRMADLRHTDCKIRMVVRPAGQEGSNIANLRGTSSQCSLPGRAC